MNSLLYQQTDELFCITYLNLFFIWLNLNRWPCPTVYHESMSDMLTIHLESLDLSMDINYYSAVNTTQLILQWKSKALREMSVYLTTGW